MATTISPTPVETTNPGERIAIKVWDLPLRLIHWSIVACILVLTVTGIYIANPFIVVHQVDTQSYLMGTIRFTHYVAAFVFTASVLFRVYWAFMGGRFARWDQFIPTTRVRLQKMGHMLRYYTFFRQTPPEEIGHNPLAGLTYFGVYLLFGLQIATGFALFALPFHGGIWPGMFGWITLAFGVPWVRLLHDLLMYLFLAFAVHHVYSAVLIDFEERSGLLSSIITGWKTLTRQHIAEGMRDAPSGKRAQRRRRGAHA
jgi:Ni/Fe-hydrogenase 1 B-type cytochrome subunit